MTQSSTLKLVALQVTSSSAPEDNLTRIENILERHKDTLERNKTLVVLPECAAIFGCGGQKMLENAEQEGIGPIQKRFADMASHYGIYLNAGSMPVKENEASSKYYATSFLYSPAGTQLARYDKIHLFDVDVDDNTSSYRESKYTEYGRNKISVELPWTSLGMTICYDLRFSGLYKSMQPVALHAIPSAFTKVTGAAHWHALLKARAIENQCFIVAANQQGRHDDGRETFGHSCIYSPWGDLLDCIKSGEGVAVSEFDNDLITSIRRKMPVLQHSLGTYE